MNSSRYVDPLNGMPAALRTALCAADDPPAAHGLDRAILAAQRHCHRLAVLVQIGQCPPSFDLDALLAQPLGQNPFGVVLREGARFGIGGVVLRPGQLAREIQLDRPCRKCDGQARRRFPRRDRPVDDADVVEDLQGPGLDDERAGSRRRGRGAVDDPRADPMPGQLVRHHQAGRPRANDENREYRLVHRQSPRCDFILR